VNVVKPDVHFVRNPQRRSKGVNTGWAEKSGLKGKKKRGKGGVEKRRK